MFLGVRMFLTFKSERNVLALRRVIPSPDQLSLIKGLVALLLAGFSCDVDRRQTRVPALR